MRLLTFPSRHRLALGIALLLLAVPAWGLDGPNNRATLKGISAVKLVIEDMAPDAERDGLTQSQLQTEVELHLRQAGITVNPDTREVLYLLVGTYQPTLSKLLLDTSNNPARLYAFTVRLELWQPVRLIRNSMVVTLAPTWSVELVGAAGARGLSGVQSTVIDKVDQFINAYLEQNPKP